MGCCLPGEGRIRKKNPQNPHGHPDTARCAKAARPREEEEEEEKEERKGAVGSREKSEDLLRRPLPLLLTSDSNLRLDEREKKERDGFRLCQRRNSVETRKKTHGVYVHLPGLLQKERDHYHQYF